MLEISSKIGYPLSRGMEEHSKPRVTFAASFNQNPSTESGITATSYEQECQRADAPSPISGVPGQLTHEGIRAVEELDNQALFKSGYLLKRSTKRKIWRKRWLVLRGTSLACYKDNKEYELERIIDLSEAKQILEVTWKTRKNVFGIIVDKKKYYLQAESRTQLDEWLNTMDYVLSGLIEDDMPEEHTHTRRGSSGSKMSTHSKSNSDNSKGYFQTHDDPTRIPSHHLAHVPSYSHISEVPSSEDDEEAGEILDEDEEIELPEGTDNKILFSGYLHKQCDMYKAWRKRWFVLRSHTLSYYKNEKEYVLHKIIPIDSIQGAFEKTQTTFKSKRFCFQLITPQRNYLIAAENQESSLAWLQAINTAVTRAKSENQHV
ncbi:hypothetical protein K7432_013455 [Basidiobolus ranarum]|uniref:PH domain-containing protein n=1 Tax=Basidiobolus ranarum TaxID=34480 RepID=A0ABR2VQT3_9FUNG